MKRLRHKKRRTFTEQQKKNQIERSFISTNIKEELLRALDTNVREFRDIRWHSRSKKYNTIKDIKYNLLHIILNAYNGHIKRHKSDTDWQTFYSVKLRDTLGQEYDRLMSMVFDKRHPSNGVSLIDDKQTLKYKLKEEIIVICDKVYLGEYKLHARIGRDGKSIITIPDYVVRNVVDGGLLKRSNVKKYQFDNVIQLNEDNILIMIKMFAELYRYRMGKKSVDIEHWTDILNSVGIEPSKYTLKHLEDRRNKAIELLNKASVDILGEGRVLQVYTEKESGRLFADEWLNIQNLPKEMRYIAMGGLGYYEYDIENAHYNFLYQLNNMFRGPALDTISKYISKTKVVRQQIASDTGVDIGVIKQIMIAMIYGADITQYHTYNEDTKQSSDNAIMSILLKYAEDNRDDATDLFDTIKANEMISGLHSEIRLSRNHMKKHWVIEKVKGVEYLLNPFRKRKRLADRYGKDEALNKLLSHMLLGVEASILVFVMEEELKDFVMPHHDGWVSINNWNTKTLEKIVKAKTARMMFDYCGIATGFDIKITKKRIGDIAKGKWTKEVLRAKTIKELIGEE